MDAEVSPLVNRSFSVEAHSTSLTNGSITTSTTQDETDSRPANLIVVYKATTNRMLRVAVNGFMESLSLVLDVMEGLDVDVLASKNAV